MKPEYSLVDAQHHGDAVDPPAPAPVIAPAEHRASPVTPHSPMQSPKVPTVFVAERMPADGKHGLLFWLKKCAPTLACIVLFILAVTVVNPNIALAWKWHQNIPIQIRPSMLVLQLTLIGMLLSLMELVSESTREEALLLCEARFGHRLTKNYVAILTGDIFGPTKRWSTTLLFFKVLPIVLGILYKQFEGGTAGGEWQTNLPEPAVRKYGIDFPRVGAWAPPNDSIYLLLTSIAAFQTASNQGTAVYPNTSSFPVPYGYNTVLISNESAAVLDIPTTAYMQALQGRLGQGEYVHINATVDAYVASLNTTSSDFVKDDKLWGATFDRRNGETGLTSMSLYLGRKEALGIMPMNDNRGTFISMYYNSTIDRGMTSFGDARDSRTKDEIREFRQRAQLYNINRGRCKARWELNATTILLQAADCNSLSSPTVDQAILLEQGLLQPFPFDILPPLVHTYEHLAIDPGKGTKDNSWLQATYSVSVASMYWARAQYMIPRSRDIKFTPYDPKDETLHLIKEVLEASPWLYVVLAVQPFVTVVALVFCICMRRQKGLPQQEVLQDGAELKLLGDKFPRELGATRA